MSQLGAAEITSGESHVSATGKPLGDPQSLPDTTEKPLGDPQSLPRTTEKNAGDAQSLLCTTEKPPGDPQSLQSTTEKPPGDPQSLLITKGKQPVDPQSLPSTTERPPGDPQSLPSTTEKPPGDPQSLQSTTEKSPGDPQSLPSSTEKTAGDPQSLPVSTNKSPDDPQSLLSATKPPKPMEYTTAVSVSNEESQNNAADQYSAAPHSQGSGTDVSSEEVKSFEQEISQKDLHVKDLSDQEEQTSTNDMCSDQGWRADTADKSEDSKEDTKLSITVKSGQQDCETGTAGESEDLGDQSHTAQKCDVLDVQRKENCSAQVLQLSPAEISIKSEPLTGFTEESTEHGLLVGTGDDSGDHDVQMSDTEESTAQGSQTGTGDNSGVFEVQKANTEEPISGDLGVQMAATEGSTAQGSQAGTGKISGDHEVQKAATEGSTEQGSQTGIGDNSGDLGMQLATTEWSTEQGSKTGTGDNSGDHNVQIAATEESTEQGSQVGIGDNSGDLGVQLATTEGSTTLGSQTGIGGNSGDHDVQMSATEESTAQGSQTGIGDNSGDHVVQKAATEEFTDQGSKTGTGDESSDQRSQTGNVDCKTFEEEKSPVNVCSVSSTATEPTDEPESQESHIDKGAGGDSKSFTEEEDVTDTAPDGPDSWTSRPGWSQSQEGHGASLQEEKSKTPLADEDSGVSAADKSNGDKEVQKRIAEKQDFQNSDTGKLRKRPLTHSGAKPKSPTASDELETRAPDTGGENNFSGCFLLIGGLIALAVAVASVPSIISWIQRPLVHHNKVLETFLNEFASVKQDFPGQYEGLWFRSEKILQKHLNTSDPSAPSILILTAARDGERTLRCVSERIAKSYALALNASWVMVSGPSMSTYDSATSKMQIDRELSSGFESSNNRAAVLYRIETLPAGSLLILYKYCDHENAAYKNVALVFPILLDEQSLEADLSFPDVEEKVKDLLWERFANSDVIAHNEMDVDKLSGVWSRISHVVLPVLPVANVEDGSCPGIQD